MRRSAGGGSFEVGMLRLNSGSSLAFVAALAFAAGWWASAQQGASEWLDAPSPESEVPSAEVGEPSFEDQALPSTAVDESRVVVDQTAFDSVSLVEPEQQEGATSSIDDAFFRDLTGAERDAFLAEHRWDYIRTNRDSILRNLEQLERLRDPRERYSKANSLLQSSIALILDVQNRAVAWEPGVPVSHPMGRGGWYSFLSSNWIYRVHVDEFPEIAYFHAGAPREVDPETGEVRFLSIDPQQLAQVHQRASQALEFYENSAPPGGD